MEHNTDWSAAPDQDSGAADEAQVGAQAASADEAQVGAQAASAGEAQVGAEAASAGAPPTPATGEPRVDAALKLLDRLGELPISDHAAVFEQVHGHLSEVLGELDTDQAEDSPARQ